jgi:3-dehydroquinate dehydratase
MGIGKLGVISRILLARAGSTLVYASVGPLSSVEGQPSLDQLRTLGVATMTRPEHKKPRGSSAVEHH